MRRFIAYLSLMICTILGIGFLIKPTLNSVNPGLDYSSGREYVYQLTNLGENISDNTETVTDKNAATGVAKEMESRLKNYGVEQYNIEIEGTDTIRVSVYSKTETLYDHVMSYLSFDGRLTLATSDFEYVYQNYTDRNQADKTDTNMFGVTAPYIGYRDIYPATVIPLEDPTTFKKAVEHALSLNKASSEDEEAKTSEEAYFYLWTNWQEGDDFVKANENENIKNKLVMRFDPTNIWWEEKEDDHKSICVLYNVAGEGEQKPNSVNDLQFKNIQDANENAKYFTALLNTSKLDYKVNLIYNGAATPIIENIINLTNVINPAFSATLIGFMVAYGLLIMFSIAIYRLGGISLSLANILGVIIVLTVFNALGGILSVASMIGFGILSIIMFISSMVFCQLLKTEIKKGKTTKKANQDAFKKSALFTIDISVVTLIIGSCIYLLGGSYLASLGIVFFFGSFINIFVNIFYLKASSYFLTSSFVCMEKDGAKYLGYNPEADKKNEELIAESADQGVLNKESNTTVVEESRIPTKKNKLSSGLKGGVLVGLGVLATLITIVTTSFVSTPYAQETVYNVTDKIYVRVEDKKTFFKDAGKIENIVDFITFEKVELTEEQKNDDAKMKEALKAKKVYKKIDSKAFSDTTNPSNAGDSIKHDYLLYVIYLNKGIDTTSTKVFYKNVLASVTLEELVSNNVLILDTEANVSLKKSSSFGLADQFHISEIAFALSIGIVVVSIYLALRYKTSHGIVAGLLAFATGAIAIGVYAIIRVPVNQFITLSAVIAVIAMLLFSLIYMFTFANNARELKESINSNNRKLADSSLEDSRNTIFGASAIFFLTIISLLFGVNALLTNMYLSTIVYVIMCYGISLFVFIPFSVVVDKFMNYLSNNIKLPTSKKGKLRKEHKARQGSKEVEEATFIGIND